MSKLFSKSGISADQILDKIEKMEKRESFFIINNDEGLSKEINQMVEKNMEERKTTISLNNHKTQHTQNSNFDLNLFEDHILWSGITELNARHNTMNIPEQTRLRFLKRVLNRLIRFHVRQQVDFNVSVTKTVNRIIENLKKFSFKVKESIEDQEKKINIIFNKIDRLEDIENKLSEQSKETEHLISAIEKNIENKLSEQSKEIEQVISEMVLQVNTDGRIKNNRLDIEKIKLEKQELYVQLSNLEKWLQLVDKKFIGLEEWVSLTSRKVDSFSETYDGFRKEVFYEIGKNKGIYTDINIINEIVDKKLYNKKIEKMDGNIRLNIGSGMESSDEYINVDLRELPGIDLIADARNLPFSSGMISEIFAAHLIEHFSKLELKKGVLLHWFDLLKKGGKLVVITPNIEAMIKAYYSEKISFENLNEVIFGGQEYHENYHFCMFNIETITNLLKEIGFTSVNVIEGYRKNGMCIEMEIEAIK
ncbi:class I SAM-dependent methyltransferase [Geosporobacter ferrireducens]|uniref:class I SAM-dependent methyltransferase n=1 Tax=Geosporobacter ferrireducens TaxID=1424294 RepID=UPI00139C6F6A|nr:hypothetical protein [Geosporobacter ferrireducens]MTI53319.1 hypothetical protein [Geosporobacter ferrireducens]